MSGVQGSNLIRRMKHRHYGVKEKKNTHCCFNKSTFAHSKGKKRGGPEWNFHRLRNWIMGRVAWIKSDLFFWGGCQFLSERQKQKQEKRWKRNNRRSRERERKGKRGRERGKWRRNAKREVVEQETHMHFRLKSKDPWFNPRFNTQADHPPQNYKKNYTFFHFNIVSFCKTHSDNKNIRFLSPSCLISNYGRARKITFTITITD